MSKMFARVTEEEGSVVGGSVELSNGESTVTGRVAAENAEQFSVEWEDGQLSVENKSDYELVVATKTAGPICQTPGCLGVANEYGVCPVHSATPSATTAPKVVNFQHNLPGVSEGVADERMALPLAKGSIHTAEENPAQPAGWAVAPVDANAYPDGELIEVEVEKREETAEWEDAQNRAPIDAENPAQPAGYAVPPASGQPIPGQGADGLMTAAGVTATVYAGDVSGENGLVELENDTIRVTGRVIAANDSEFVVKWEDDTNTVENKSDYNLVVADLNEDEYLDFEDVNEFEERTAADASQDACDCSEFVNTDYDPSETTPEALSAAMMRLERDDPSCQVCSHSFGDHTQYMTNGCQSGVPDSDLLPREMESRIKRRINKDVSGFLLAE